jgi:hypothetical protein
MVGEGNDWREIGVINIKERNKNIGEKEGN